MIPSTLRLRQPFPTLDIAAHSQDSLYVRVLFSPDSRTLLSVSEMDPCRLWEPRTGKLLGEFGTGVCDAKFSPDGRLLLTIAGRELSIWEMPSGRLSHQWELPSDCATVCGFSNDGTMCGVGGGGYALGIGWYAAWDLARSSQLCHGELKGGDEDEIGVMAIGTAVDGRFAAWAVEQCNLPSAAFVHDLETGTAIAQGRFEGRVRVYPPTFVAASDINQRLQLCDLLTGEYWEGPSLGQHLPIGSARASWLAWVRDTDRSANSNSGSLAIYNVERREIRHTLPIQPACASLGFSLHHDDILATITKLTLWKGSPEHTVFWHVPSGAIVGWAQRHQMHACYAFSPDTKWFASGTNAHSSSCARDGIAAGTVLVTNLSNSRLESEAD